jgi:3-dehydroquinate synthase
MINFKIDLGSVNYPVTIDNNILNDLDNHINKIKPSGSIVILIDDSVAKLREKSLNEWQNDARYHIYVVPGGKNNKSFYSVLKIFEYLDLNNISRDSTIVAIGGGVIGDMGGFIASCWYRGIALIHVPTTLLSAVDSCVGGKTAINFRSTVNAVGTYHHPCAILIDMDMMYALPDREIKSGFGEIIKYACIGADHIKKILEESKLENLDQLATLIHYSLKEKERFVCDDIGEKANRLFLNFGHTIGHAIEFSTVFDGEETLRHGEGVALGILAIFRICVKLGFLQEIHIDSLKQMLIKYGLPIDINSQSYGIDRANLIERIVDLCFKDKKRVMNELRLILINSDFNPFIHKTNNRKLIEYGVMEVVK